MIGAAVMGGGVVGFGVAQMLNENATKIESVLGEAVRAKYILDIRDIPTPDGVKLTHTPDEILTDPEVRVVAETIGGCGAAYELTKRALSSGRSVVTSNKELVATHGDELVALAAAHGVRYRYEASVGGGIPVLDPILNCLCANVLTGIDGIVNGSTNYLLTRMADEGLPFDQALVNAKALGYVEANPAADVEGWDAKRKLMILAHCAFGARFDSGADLPVKGISALTPDDMRAAEAFGGAVKLIAHAQLDGESWSGWVHPCFVPAAHPLHGVRDVFNGIIVHGNFVDDVMFYGRGAGRQPTASAVVGDIVSLCRDLDRVEKPATTASGPRYRAGDAPIGRLFRTDAAGRDALIKTCPDWEARPCGDGFAVMSAPLSDADFNARVGGLRVSDPIYVIG